MNVRIFESVRWNACVHRLDPGIYSHPKEFWGNGVRTHVNSKEKIPSKCQLNSVELTLAWCWDIEQPTNEQPYTATSHSPNNGHHQTSTPSEMHHDGSSCLPITTPPTALPSRGSDGSLGVKCSCNGRGVRQCWWQLAQRPSNMSVYLRDGSSQPIVRAATL